MKRLPILAALLTLWRGCVPLLPAHANEPLLLRGVNLAGAESTGSIFGMPQRAAIDYFYDKGMRVFRITFSHERMCPVPGGPLAEPYASRFEAIVGYALAKPNAQVILDLHSSLRYRVGATITDSDVSGGTQVMVGQSGLYTKAQFQDFWARMATRFNGSNLIYEIANEPVAWDGSAVPILGLVATINAGIAGIRSTSAANRILFNLNGYGTYGWRTNVSTGSDNRANIENVVDPLKNSLIDMHHYVDKWGPGTSPKVASDYMSALTGFTAYMRSVGRKAFLGEFGFGSDAVSLAAGTAVLAYVEANRDVWTGWAYWDAVPYQDSYIFQLLPTELTKIGPFDPLPGKVTHRPQMNVLAPLLAAP